MKSSATPLPKVVKGSLPPPPSKAKQRQGADNLALAPMITIKGYSPSGSNSNNSNSNSVTAKKVAPVVLPTPTSNNKPNNNKLSSKASKSKIAPKASTSNNISTKGTAIASPVETLSAKAQRLLASPVQATEEYCGSTGSVPIKFNHYNKLFPIHNGVLKWKDVDDEYCFSYVYKGNYSREISFIPSGMRNPYKATLDDLIGLQKDENSEYFLGLVTSGAYVVNVVEDAAAGVGIEGITLRSGPLVLSGSEDVKSGNLQVKLLTSELKSLDPALLQTAEAKDLIEKRDLEDILFSKS